jgi:hypothetical protein
VERITDSYFFWLVGTGSKRGLIFGIEIDPGIRTEGTIIASDPTFGSFTLLELISRQVNRFLW